MPRRISHPLRVAAAVLVLGAFALSAAAAGKSATTPASRAPGDADKAKRIERGKFIAMVSGCNDCHTPGALYGAPDFSRTLSGSELGWSGPWGTTYARNLTPETETGLGYYSAREIVAALRGGKRLDGTPMLPPMPWQDLTPYTDGDLTALAEYLLSLPAISHAVPDRLPPGKTPTGSFLTLPPPSAWDAPRTPPAEGEKH